MNDKLKKNSTHYFYYLIFNLFFGQSGEASWWRVCSLVTCSLVTSSQTEF